MSHDKKHSVADEKAVDVDAVTKLAKILAEWARRKAVKRKGRGRHDIPTYDQAPPHGPQAGEDG